MRVISILSLTLFLIILLITPTSSSIVSRKRITHKLLQFQDTTTSTGVAGGDDGTATDTDSDTDSSATGTGTPTGGSPLATDAPTTVTTTTDSPTTAATTSAPGSETTNAPTSAATDTPTGTVTDTPTSAATDAPTSAATDAPTSAATEAPTGAATAAPTSAGTETPGTETPIGGNPTAPATDAPTTAATTAPTDAATAAPTSAATQAPEATSAPTTPTGNAGGNTGGASTFPGPNSNPDVCPQVNHTSSLSGSTITFNSNSAKALAFVDVHVTASSMFLNYRMIATAGVTGTYTSTLPNSVSGDISYWFTYVTDVAGTQRGCDTSSSTGNVVGSGGADGPGSQFGGQPAQAGQEGTVCYQEIVGSLSGSYAQVNAAFDAWATRAYTALGLTGARELSIGWAQVPDRVSFENNCTGPYTTVADLFVHIDSNTVADDYQTLSNKLEAFIAANPLTSDSAITCSARSVVSGIPICGVGISGNPSNSQCTALAFDYNIGQDTVDNRSVIAIRFDLPSTSFNGTFDYVDVHVKNGDATFNYRMTTSASIPNSYVYPLPLENLDQSIAPTVSYYFTYSVSGQQCDSASYTYTVSQNPVPTTAAPTTAAPTTEAPTTAAPTTQAPTTAAPTTEAPTTAAPTTEAPTTAAPTTEAPTTAAPTTEAPTTAAPTTEAPTTAAPVTEAPTTAAPTCEQIQWCVAGTCTGTYPTAQLASTVNWSCINRVCTAA